MNNSERMEPRHRTRTLLIVEGHHEKEKLFKLLLNCFPEINIRYEDILIYGTNIYQLYQYIVEEYDEDWDNGSFDVDLPRIVSKRLNFESLLEKRDFTNIFLVFDYERHDPNFSEEKLTRLQNFFCEASEEGQLYINYPMIESYQHILEIPDHGYEDRWIPVTLQSEQNYKNVTKDTFVAKLVNLPQKMFEILNDRFELKDEELCWACVDSLLKIKENANLHQEIGDALKAGLNEPHLATARYQMADLIRRTGYTDQGLSFFEYSRNVLTEIILHNICKANKLQNGVFTLQNEEYRNAFFDIDWSTILSVQNNASKDELLGIIWILNTCVTFVPEYNFGLLAVD